MRNLIENSGLVLSFAAVAGLLFPIFSGHVSPYITLLLMIAMSLSMRQIVFSGKDIGPNLSASIKALLLNYGFQSAVVLVSAFYLISNPDHIAGFVIIAAVPPAVAVIPYTYLLGGDRKASLGGEVLSYITALGLAPLITILFLSFGVDVLEILRLLALLIVTPLIISRAFQRLPGSYFSRSRAFVNICFALIVYSAIGLNQAAIFNDLVIIAPLFFILFLKTFATGLSAYSASMKLGARKDRAVSYALFAGYKNCGMAAAFSIALFGAAASLPAAIGIIVELLFFISLQAFLGRHG